MIWPFAGATRIVRRRGMLIRRVFVTADLIALDNGLLPRRGGVRVWTPGRGPSLAQDRGRRLFGDAADVAFHPQALRFLYGQDEKHTAHSTADEIVPVLHAVTIGVWLFEGGAWLTGLAEPQFPKVFLFWTSAVVLVVLGRALARPQCRRSSSYIQNTIVVGSGEIGQLLARKLVQHPEYGLNLVGFVDEHAPRLDGSVDGVPFLGLPSELSEIIRDRDVERVILAGPTDDDQRTIHELKGCDVQIDIVPRLFDALGPSTAIH